MSLGGISSFYPFGYGFSRRYISKKYEYFLQPGSVNPALTLAETKAHLRIDSQNTLEDTLITNLITAATLFGESYTKRDFIIKQYLTYRDNFDLPLFVLRKSLYQSLTSFQYLVNGTFIDVPSSLYYITVSNDFSAIRLVVNQSWPNDLDDQDQSIKIIFNAGYTATTANVPQQIKTALLQHIAQMYENRGDATELMRGENPLAGALPPESKLIYDLYRIKDLNTIPY